MPRWCHRPRRRWTGAPSMRVDRLTLAPVSRRPKERAVVEAYVGAVSSRNLAALGPMLDVGAHFMSPAFGDARGREGVVHAHEALFGAFEDRQLDVSRVWRTDSAQMVEWTFRGVLDRPFGRMPASHEPAQLPRADDLVDERRRRHHGHSRLLRRVGHPRADRRGDGERGARRAPGGGRRRRQRGTSVLRPEWLALGAARPRVRPRELGRARAKPREGLPVRRDRRRGAALPRRPREGRPGQGTPSRDTSAGSTSRSRSSTRPSRASGPSPTS